MIRMIALSEGLDNEKDQAKESPETGSERMIKIH